MVSYSLSLVPDWWFVNAPFGVHMDYGSYLIVSDVILVVGFATTWSAVLRSVVVISAGATALWWVMTVVIGLAEFFVLAIWLGISTVAGSGSIELIAELASLGILGVIQGLILGYALRVRVAALLWVVGFVAAFAAGYAFLATGLLARLTSGQSDFQVIALGNAILGFVEGGITGAILLVLLRLSARAGTQSITGDLEAADFADASHPHG